MSDSRESTLEDVSHAAGAAGDSSESAKEAAVRATHVDGMHEAPADTQLAESGLTVHRRPGRSSIVGARACGLRDTCGTESEGWGSRG